MDMLFNVPCIFVSPLVIRLTLYLGVVPFRELFRDAYNVMTIKSHYFLNFCCVCVMWLRVF